MRCLEPLRDEDEADDVDKNDNDDDEASVSFAASPTRARFLGETLLSDSEAESIERFVGVESAL